MPWAIVLALLLRHSAARAAAPLAYPLFTTHNVLTFPFDDARLLARGHREAGAAWVTPNARPGADLPLFVYLHGLNRDHRHRRWMHGAPLDLRAMVGPLAMDGLTGPMIIAVPNTTGADAQADRTIYWRFDVAAFVDAVDRVVAARGVRVDRARVTLSAHSASSCAERNGFFAGLASPAVHTLFDIDGCMTRRFGGMLGGAPARQRVVVVYQTHMWPRDYHGFVREFRERAAAVTPPPDEPHHRVLERVEITGIDAHNQLVEGTLRRWLPRLIPPAAAPEAPAPAPEDRAARATGSRPDG